MKIEGFELVGHFNMIGDDETRYPEHVVPVGSVDGALRCVFQSKQGIGIAVEEYRSRDPSRLVRYGSEVLRGLQGFNPVRHILFAFSPTDVVAYEKCYQNLFFRALLEDPAFGGDSKHKPLLRLSLAKTIGDRKLIEPELIAVRDVLSIETPNFAQRWYDREVKGSRD